MLLVQAASLHQQVILPGSTIGTSMPVTRLIAAVLQIVITGATLLEPMYKRLTALTKKGTSCHFAQNVTSVQVILMWTRNLFQSQVICKPTPLLLRKTKSTVDGITSSFVFLLFLRLMPFTLLIAQIDQNLPALFPLTSSYPQTSDRVPQNTCLSYSPRNLLSASVYCNYQVPLCRNPISLLR